MRERDAAVSPGCSAGMRRQVATDARRFGFLKAAPRRTFMLLRRSYVIAILQAYLRTPRQKILAAGAAIRAGRRPLLRYGLAIAMVVLGWLAREGLSSAVGPTALPFVFLFPAVAMAGWFGGLDRD